MENKVDTIRRMYSIENKTVKEIADYFGYKNGNSIYMIMKKEGIPRKNRYDCQKKFTYNIEELKELYLTHKKSTEEIGEIYSISAETIRKALIKNNITLRPKTCNFGGHNKGKKIPLEQKKRMSFTIKESYRRGERVHWNKGNHWALDVRKKISETLLNGREPSPSYYGDDWKIQRTSCLQRDNYRCQQCNASERLEVHHWEPYRFSYNNSMYNLVTLCHVCHSELHKTYIQEGFIADAESAMYG